MTEDNVAIELEGDRNRYVLRFDGEFAGVAHFLPHGDQRVFTHTVVDDRFEGQGLGSQLVRAALDGTREDGKRIVPVCPFVDAYVQRHHDWDDLIDQPSQALLASLPD